MAKLTNYAFDIAFALQSTKTTEDVTPQEILAALRARVDYLEKHPEEIEEAVGAAFDSFEVDEVKVDTLYQDDFMVRLCGKMGVIRSIYGDKKTMEIVAMFRSTVFEVDIPLLQALTMHHLRMAGYSGADLNFDVRNMGSLVAGPDQNPEMVEFLNQIIVPKEAPAKKARP